MIRSRIIERYPARAGWGSLMPAVSLGAAGLIWLALMIEAIAHGQSTLAGLAVFGALALGAGALASASDRAQRVAHLADAAASGAMLAAAFILVVPHALIVHRVPGAVGLLIGVLGGLLIHRQARPRPENAALMGLILHTFCAGIALGVLYTFLPALGWPAGLAILAHKGPAGFLLARRLQQAGKDRTLVAWPALATGLGALPIAMIRTSQPFSGGLLFGIAAGLFLVVAIGFLRDGRAVKFRQPSWWLAGLAGGTGIALLGPWL